MKKRLWNNHILIFILVVFVVLYLLFISKFGIDLEDERLLMYQGIRLLNGEIPWRDFTLTYTGGSMFLNAFLFRIFGINIMIIRYTLIIFSLLTAFFIWLLSKKLMPTKFAIFPPMLFLILGLPFCFVQYPGWYFILFVFLSVFALLFYYQSRKRLWLLAAGICAGATFLFKYSVGIFHFTGIILAIFFVDSISHTNYKKRIWGKWILLFFISLFYVALIREHLCSSYIILLLQVFTTIGLIIVLDVKNGFSSNLQLNDFIFPATGFLISISPLILYLWGHNIFYEFLSTLCLTTTSINETCYAPFLTPIPFPSLIIIYPFVLYPILISLPKHRIRNLILLGAGYLIIIIISVLYIKDLSFDSIKHIFFRSLWESRRYIAIFVYGISCIYIYRNCFHNKLLSLSNILFTFIYIIGTSILFEFYPICAHHILYDLAPSFILGFYLLYKSYCNLKFNSAKIEKLWKGILFLLPVCFLFMNLFLQMDHYIDMKTLLTQQEIVFDKRPTLPFYQFQVRVSEEEYKEITGIKCYMDSVLDTNTNIFTTLPIFYMLLNKDNPTKITVYRSANLLRNRETQLEFIKDLEQKKILYIIDHWGTLFSLYPEENKMLQLYLETHYFMVREIGSCQIYKRR